MSAFHPLPTFADGPPVDPLRASTRRETLHAVKTVHLLAGLALAAQSLPLAAEPGIAADRLLSPPRDFTGVYVTNFEIGYFVECDPAGDCADWVQQEMRWLTGSTAQRESALMECIARWNGSRDRWALYAIFFRGRETLDRRPKRFMHDTERRVLLDDIIALELIGTDQTVGLLLPQYRREPRMAC
jgi:hypothetical protein